MPPNRLFIDPDTDELDTDRLLLETKPIALLLFAFGAVGVVLLLLAEGVFPGSIVHRLLSLAAEFVFTLGGFVTALYVLVRALQLVGGFEVRTGTSTTDGGPPTDATGRHEIPVRDGSNSSASVSASASASESDSDEPGTDDTEDDR